MNITDWISSGEVLPGELGRNLIDRAREIAGARFNMVSAAVEVVESNPDAIREREHRRQLELDSIVKEAEQTTAIPPSQEVRDHAEALDQPAVIASQSMNEQKLREERYRQMLNDIHEGNLHA